MCRVLWQRLPVRGGGTCPARHSSGGPPAPRPHCAAASTPAAAFCPLSRCHAAHHRQRRQSAASERPAAASGRAGTEGRGASRCVFAQELAGPRACLSVPSGRHALSHKLQPPRRCRCCGGACMRGAGACARTAPLPVMHGQPVWDLWQRPPWGRPQGEPLTTPTAMPCCWHSCAGGGGVADIHPKLSQLCRTQPCRRWQLPGPLGARRTGPGGCPGRPPRNRSLKASAKGRLRHPRSSHVLCCAPVLCSLNGHRDAQRRLHSAVRLEQTAAQAAAGAPRTPAPHPRGLPVRAGLPRCGLGACRARTHPVRAHRVQDVVCVAGWERGYVNDARLTARLFTALQPPLQRPRSLQGPQIALHTPPPSPQVRWELRRVRCRRRCCRRTGLLAVL